jgi:hypothetical protein
MRIGSKPKAVLAACAALIAAACGPFGGNGGGSYRIIDPQTASQMIHGSDSLLALVPPRDLETIRAELETARTEQIAAENDERNAQLLQARAATAIKVKDAERKAMEARLDLAEREKDEIATSEWRSKLQVAEREKELLERRETLRNTEMEVARAQRDYSQARIEALDVELKLQAMRAQRAEFVARGTSAEVLNSLIRLDADLADLEKETLERQSEVAERRRDVANREVDLTEKRRKVLEAQIRLTQGR